MAQTVAGLTATLPGRTLMTTSMSETPTRNCPTCGKAYEMDVRFCLHDGTRIAEAEKLTGKLLDGRYRIEEVLGEGGMGIVYRARHIHIDAPVAVKVLHPELVSDQSAIERFRREARAAGRIQHPHAVRVTDFGVAEDMTVYLVMDLVDGRSLRELLEDGVSFTPQQIVRILGQVCAAVEAAHQSGVIHRDLKPDNIMVKGQDNELIAWVLDFGIAKLKQQGSDDSKGHTLTQAGMIIGTPNYMSPEQCRGHNLDARSDIYSLGVIAYEMLAGEPLFDGESTFEIVAKHLSEQPRQLRELKPEVPAALARTVMRALEKEPGRRPASAIEFSRELEQALSRSEKHTGALKVGAATQVSPAGGRADERHRDVAADQKTTMDSHPAVASQAAATSGLSSRGLLLAGTAVLLIGLIGTLLYLFSQRSGHGQPDPSSGRTTTAPTNVSEKDAVQGMVLVPGGKFVMGRDDGDADERPAHEVEVKAFYLDKYEVTNEQYRQFTDATKRVAMPKHWKNNGSFAPEDARLPVTFVTWQDAADYARWAKKRLPTEEEWEYAARGGRQENLYPWGPTWNPDNAYAARQDATKPVPVESLERDRSAFGIYDLSGNVSEWVQNSFRRYNATADEKWKVYRGGNFVAKAGESTTTFRWYDFPAPPADAMQKKDYDQKVFPVVGFRCAKDVEK